MLQRLYISSLCIAHLGLPWSIIGWVSLTRKISLGNGRKIGQITFFGTLSKYSVRLSFFDLRWAQLYVSLVCIKRCFFVFISVFWTSSRNCNCCDLSFLYLYSSLYLYLSLCFELWVAMCISWKQLLWCEFYESTRGTSFQQGSQQAKVKCDNNIRKFSEKYSEKYLLFKREMQCQYLRESYFFPPLSLDLHLSLYVKMLNLLAFIKWLHK